ncbi:MAG: PEGA domain-containing protein, partial [Acidobacteriota bacterium]
MSEGAAKDSPAAAGPANQRRFVLEDADGRRTMSSADFPLSVGGEGSGLRLEGWRSTRAWLGLDAGDLFLQRAGSEGAADSRWLQAGDRVELGDGGVLKVESAREGLLVRLEKPSEAGGTAGVQLVPPPRRPEDRGPAPARPIEPVAFTPARERGTGDASGGRRRLLGLGLAALLLMVLGGLALFLLSARSVELQITPPPERVVLEGSPLRLELGGRFLVLRGEYTVRASLEGYRDLESPITVGDAARQVFDFELRRLPGRLALTALSGAALNAPQSLEEVELAADGLPVDLPDPDEGADEPFSADLEAQKPGALEAEIFLDGELAGTTPAEIEVEAGVYRLRLAAERHEPFEINLEIEGAGEAQRLDAVLAPRWGTVFFTSRPSGARLTIDGEDRGSTPAAVELLQGVRAYRLSRAGFAPRSGTVTVEAGSEQAVGPVALEPSKGNVSITSQPAGAAVRVGDRYRGETPLELSLEPGRSHRLRITKAGFEPAESEITVSSGEAEDLHLELRAQVGSVVIDVFPPDAEVRVGGQVREERRLELPAGAALSVAAGREGYVAQSAEVTPLAGREQRVELRLEAEGEARERAIREVQSTSEGHELVILEPGRFRMGASRREPGRRSNETLREVELSRRLYLSAHEVTNAQFRRFRPDHRSGRVGSTSLDADAHPVVQVSWQDAAAYCNWLSEREGLEPAYQTAADGKSLVAKPAGERPSTGYRLPTEAEWTWAARYGGGGAAAEGRKYPWGDALPVAAGAGNFADAAAADLVSATVPDYRDGFAATAPVDAFG